MSPRQKIVYLLAGLLLGSGCAQDTALVVNVQALPGVHDENGADPVDLLVTFQSQKDPVPQEHILSAKGAFYTDPGKLETRFSLLANGHAGPISLEVDARGVAKRVVGSGIATAMLADGETVETEMTLYPSDMQVNTEYANSQFVSLTTHGRQLASDSQGNFIALWREWEQCQQSRGLRCDIFGRLYDARAVPRINAKEGNAAQFVVNPEPVFHGQPAVAMQPDGSYLVAWLQAFSDRTVVSLRSFMPDGQLDANMTASEVVISTDAENAHVGGPDVAALPNGNYFVAWVESTDEGGTAEIRSRIVTRAGTPADGAASPTTVAPINTIPDWLLFDPDVYYLYLIDVAVAAGPDGNAMVAWTQPCSPDQWCWELKARAYVHNTGYGTIQSGSATGTQSAGPFDLAGLPYGYALAWSDVVSSDTNEGMDVLVRRFDAAGAPLDEDGFVVNTSRQGHQYRPAITAHSNGTMLVVWTTEDSSQDPEHGLRARRLMANGLPVGQDFSANTTMRARQDFASLTPGANDSFILLFEDDSEIGPDQLKTGIRARLLYPDYDPRDGQVGSLCSAGSCQTGLYCWTMPIAGRGNEQRCVDECQEPGALCPNGGRCLQVPEQSKYLCVYNQ